MSPWAVVNRKLIAKAISELHFEEILKAEDLQEEAYKIDLSSGVSYFFTGRLSAWNHLWVNENSIERRPPESGDFLSAGTFFIDSRQETKMSPTTLAHFLEEMNKTLSSDLVLQKKEVPAVSELATWSGDRLQAVLVGHPKLILNKGRLGWGREDSKSFSPEEDGIFQLRWLLVPKNLLTGSETEEVFDHIPCPEHMKVVPVHPWQWDNVISHQFQHEIESGSIVDLGVFGEFYRPQVSLRTLSAVENEKDHDLKLPLSILNTSCVRGIPHHYLTFTPELSQRLEHLIKQDDLLSSRGVEVLLEKSAWGVTQKDFHRIQEAPYRFHEHLGYVVRESVSGKLKENEMGVLAGALIHQDSEGRTLIGEYARRAGLTLTEWLEDYANHVIIPLIHLQSRYGIGLVAHGQNVVVKLTDHRPTGLFLKDFHGDLRLSTQHEDIHREFLGTLASKLTKLAPEHLIHDLITGHFVTVLRFVAGALAQCGEMDEENFYRIISLEIRSYYDSFPLKNKNIDLLSPTFKRVLVNAVRFKIGYGDPQERPLPILGSDLANPFHQDVL